MQPCKKCHKKYADFCEECVREMLSQLKKSPNKIKFIKILNLIKELKNGKKRPTKKK